VSFARSAVAAPGLVAVALMIGWAVHNGGYDADTWYWGALVLLAVLAAAVVQLRPRRSALSRPALLALAALASYVAWSYLSMAWAAVPGWALEGGNRALLYLIVFAVFIVVPWTAERAAAVLLVFAVGIGVIAFVLLVRFASADHLNRLVVDGRLAAPTGYFNATVALFTIASLVATVLATRRELPGLVRGGLVAIACASLQVAVMGQSRGWLFTLPLVVLAATAVVRDRLRVAAAAVFPIAGVLVPLHRLLAVFKGQSGGDLNPAAMSAGHRALEVCAVVFVLGTVAAWGEHLIPAPGLTAAARRRLGAGVAALAVALALTGAFAATDGDPLGFVKRQWHGFTHQAGPNPGGSHFGAVGSGRYDFWRVSLNAFVAHPLGGLGQDNFGDYYIPRARTAEQPRWVHSLELQQLASTGAVGFALFAAFLAAAVWAAVPALRRGSAATTALAGAALLPSIVWIIHGSVDWFWEMPALSAPALGFLGMAVRLGSAGQKRTVAAIPSMVGRIAGPVVLLAAVAALAFPYLSVRHVSIASDRAARNPAAALAELATAADLNPWSPDPGRLAGVIALQTGRFLEAERRFRQVVSREPGGWYGWLGDGLAASALGDRARAARDFNVAGSINGKQPVLRAALARVNGLHPLTFAEATRALAGAY
jgi:hypothetical protein